MTMEKLVVFDLDGTLNQTHLFSVPAHQATLKEFGGADFTDEFIISLYGARSDDYMKILLPDSDDIKKREYLNRVSYYENIFIKEKGKYYDGVMEALTKLRSKGYLTAVCSNASNRYINFVLENLKLSPYIDYVQQLIDGMTKNDTLKLLLDKVKPAKAVMVGDRKFDMDAAQFNKIPFIGCLYGYNPDEVKSADITIESAYEIFDAVEKLIG